MTSNFDSYKIYYKTTAGGIYTYYDTSSSLTPVLSSLTPNTSYYIRLIPYSNTSGFYGSTIDTSSTTMARLTAFSTGTVGTNNINLTWSGNYNYVKIYYGTTSGLYTNNTISYNNTANITGLSFNTGYYFNVIPYNNLNISGDYYGEINASTSSYTGNGLRYYYYNTRYTTVSDIDNLSTSSSSGSGTVTTAITTNTYKYDSTNTFSLSSTLNASCTRTGFTMKWIGYFIPDTSGTWTFTLNSDDGSWFLIDLSNGGTYTTILSASDSGGGRGGEQTVSISMYKNTTYPIKLFFNANNANPTFLYFYYKKPGDTTAYYDISGFYYI